jgi:hypothetical protein
MPGMLSAEETEWLLLCAPATAQHSERRDSASTACGVRRDDDEDALRITPKGLEHLRSRDYLMAA